MKIEFLKQFRKDTLKLNHRQLIQLKKRMKIFKNSPNQKMLNNHGLKGRLKGRFSINITGDLRALYKIEKHNQREDIVKFIKLASHSELY